MNRLIKSATTVTLTLSSLFLCSLSYAASIQVTTGGACSLDEAITSANTDTNYGGCVRTGSVANTNDLINVSAGTYNVSHLPSITSNVVISGASESSTNVQLSSSANFSVGASGSPGQLSLRYLRVTGAASNPSHCVIVRQYSSAYLYAAKLTKCYNGMSVHPGAFAAVDWSNLTDNAGYGIYSSGDLTAYGSDITWNKYSGVRLTPGANAQIYYGTIAHNADGGLGGGGIHSDRAELVVHGVTVANNVAVKGGGLYGRDSAIAVTQSEFLNNEAYKVQSPGDSTPAMGGGILVTGRHPSNSALALDISNARIRYNQSSGYGGGIAVLDDGASAGTMFTAVRCTLAENVASNDGGGLYMLGQGELDVSTVSGNTSGGRGGGVFMNGLSQFELHMRESTIVYNSAHGSGGGVFLALLSNPDITANLIANNSAVSGAVDLDISGAQSAGVPWAGQLFLGNTSGIIVGTHVYTPPVTGNAQLGGLTWVSGQLLHPLGQNSAARNTRNDTDTDSAGDQRYKARPTNPYTLDFGAYEY